MGGARPGRKPLPVEDPASPVGAFALSLRRLREDAGRPAYRTLAEETRRNPPHYGATALRLAAAGRKLPALDVVEAFVRACCSHARAFPETAQGGAAAWVERQLLDKWRLAWRQTLLAESSAHEHQDVNRPHQPVLAGLAPITGTAIVGRADELALVRARLTDRQLVTLVGLGGVGKTRLAVEIAVGQDPVAPDGVCWVGLDRIGPRDSAAEAACRALGVLGAHPDPMEALLAACRRRRGLLVLDNCEHVLAGARELATVLARHAPAMRVLATSRQPLATPHEATVVL